MALRGAGSGGGRERRVARRLHKASDVGGPSAYRDPTYRSAGRQVADFRQELSADPPINFEIAQFEIRHVMRAAKEQRDLVTDAFVVAGTSTAGRQPVPEEAELDRFVRVFQHRST